MSTFATLMSATNTYGQDAFADSVPVNTAVQQATSAVQQLQALPAIPSACAAEYLQKAIATYTQGIADANTTVADGTQALAGTGGADMPLDGLTEANTTVKTIAGAGVDLSNVVSILSGQAPYPPC